MVNSVYIGFDSRLTIPKTAGRRVWSAVEPTSSRLARAKVEKRMSEMEGSKRESIEGRGGEKSVEAK